MNEEARFLLWLFKWLLACVGAAYVFWIIHMVAIVSARRLKPEPKPYEPVLARFPHLAVGKVCASCRYWKAGKNTCEVDEGLKTLCSNSCEKWELY